MKLFKGSIYRNEAGCFAWRAIAAWHALYAKSKLVPLTPAGDISVGYYLYKSMKLFNGLITHYSYSYHTHTTRPGRAGPVT